MAQVRALVREDVLEELFAGEVLEMRVVDPALAHILVGQAVICLSNSSPIMKRVSMPGRPFSLKSGAICPSVQSQSTLPASRTSTCLRVMIWSSRALE